MKIWWFIEDDRLTNVYKLACQFTKLVDYQTGNLRLVPFPQFLMFLVEQALN